MPDVHKNFSASLVATAPSPAASGTSLVVTAAEGALFPTVPFNCTIWPAGEQPTAANAEIVRVTGISTDTFTITRTQESTSARTVVVGDQIAATITNKTLTDIETVMPTLIATSVLGSPAASIDFSSIPATFRHLHLIVVGRSDRAAQVGDTLILRLNNDSGSNYDTQILRGNNATASASNSAGATSAVLGLMTGAAAGAGLAGYFSIVIPWYAETTFQQSVISQNADFASTSAADMFGQLICSHWRNTAAVNQVTLLSQNSANLIAGAAASLYGMP